MNISICKWYNNAASPVLFFIDDFANVWVDTNGNGIVDLEEDWGYWKNHKNSSFRFLNEVVLNDFPNIKTTFFTPVGARVGMIENPQVKTVSKMINCDEETKAFFKSINDKENFEIAYHGTTHGKVGKTSSDFKQEWKLFKSIDEAVDTINKGKEIYKTVFGYYPKGGKYCGYEANEFSDESIARTDFLWWCRYYNRGLLNDKNHYIYSDDFNTVTSFDIKVFGKNEVIDIPSTVNGGLLTGIFNPNKKTLKGIAKIILKNYLLKKKLNEIEFLLKNNLVISIQEHISPARDDGRRQLPNIFDDKESLKFIFNYLKDKNVWYCTGTEVAEYYILRNNIKFIGINDNGFAIEYIGKRNLEKMIISIKIDRNNIMIIEPNSEIVFGDNGVFNIHVQDGLYKFVENSL
ncbi:hypothetical protein [Clostridium gelidum]|uniref:hypothetical protein n=1 Tax=Clostridium gelidum TaxID=704125 RepID=UPI001CC54855|nr:hypothetical protein [Clostridium gelidum]